jgi:hypothetical protein
MSKLQNLKPKLTYANVVATLALIVAVSGGATAVAISVSKNSVTTNSIRKGAVTAPKLGKVTTRLATATGTTAVAECQKGEKLLGGGGATGGGSGALSVSIPANNAWRVSSSVTGPSTINEAYALCLRK